MISILVYLIHQLTPNASTLSLPNRTQKYKHQCVATLSQLIETCSLIDTYRHLLSLAIMITVFWILACIACFTIMTMILMSADKLKTPFLRLIFGLSVSGAITSIASFFQPFVMPEGAVLAYGTQVSCDAVAFPLHVGDTALQLYSLGLYTNYLHAIRNNRRVPVVISPRESSHGYTAFLLRSYFSDLL